MKVRFMAADYVGGKYLSTGNLSFLISESQEESDGAEFRAKFEACGHAIGWPGFDWKCGDFAGV
jgi:hypothetical protein